MKPKVLALSEVVAMIPHGARLMVGGFMGGGSPVRLIDELLRQGKRGLTLICNDTARPGYGVSKLIAAGCIERLITSHIGTNPQTQQLLLQGHLQVELVPQGTLAERIRAGGVGLGGVLTPTGVGTLVAEGKRTIEVDGCQYLLELALRADFSLIRAQRADYLGNLEYALTARNFNPLMALAADLVIVETDELVEVGELDPECIVTPGVVVHKIVVAEGK